VRAEDELETLDPQALVGPAEFVKRLLERGELAPVRGPLKRVKAKNAARIAFMKDAIVRGALHWLVRSGGWRMRHVVAGKRRREARLWGQGVYENLDLRYSAATLELVAAVAKCCQKPPSRELPGQGPVMLGDVVIFHLTLDPFIDSMRLPVEEAPKPPEPPKPASGVTRKPQAAAATPAPAPRPASNDRAKLLEGRRAVLALSPLTALFRADEVLPEDKLATNEQTILAIAQAAKLYTPLVQGDRAVLLTYLDDALAHRWIERESLRRSLSASSAAPGYLAFALALEGFASAARTAARPDALRPLLRFFERYLVRFGQREVELETFKKHSQMLVRASDRARFLATVARLFAVARVIATEAERVLATPFVDRTEEEKVFIADASEFTRSILPELEAIRRELAGEVG
jgi:hypothetical protein